MLVHLGPHISESSYLQFYLTTDMEEAPPPTHTPSGGEES